jgi:RNA polymerase sigma factor (sigma-70 family)
MPRVVGDNLFEWSVAVEVWVGASMSTSDPGDRSEAHAAGQFVTTHWSAVVRAGEPDSASAYAALSELCGTYWYPLYAFARHQGHSPHDAEDLTQAFFEKLLEKGYVADACQEKGRFRAFLLTAFKRFLANDWDRRHAHKRGGFHTVVSIDQERAESRFESESAHALQPDLLYDRQWIHTLLAQVMALLEREYRETGRTALFEHLRGCLAKEESALSYAEVAAQLKLTEPAVKMAVHRLRARYRELLRTEIGRTVASPAEVDGEIRHLFAALGG